MMTYAQMVEWNNCLDLLGNRVGICNQMMGARYHHSMENHMRVCRDARQYVVTFDGEPVASFAIWDLEGLRRTLDVVNAWHDCIWALSRAGMVRAA